MQSGAVRTRVACTLRAAQPHVSVVRSEAVPRILTVSLLVTQKSLPRNLVVAFNFQSHTKCHDGRMVVPGSARLQATPSTT